MMKRQIRIKGVLRQRWRWQDDGSDAAPTVRLLVITPPRWR
jgi:hypothetical protein